MKRYTVRITTSTSVRVLAADEQEAIGKATQRMFDKRAEWRQDPSDKDHGCVTKPTEKGRVGITGRARLEVMGGWPATFGLVPKAVELEGPFEPERINGEMKRDALEGPIKRVVPDLSRFKRIY